MTVARFVGTVRVIKDHNVETQFVLMKTLPRFFGQCVGVSSVENSSPLRLNRVEQ